MKKILKNAKLNYFIISFICLILSILLLTQNSNLNVFANFESEVNHKSSVLVEYNTGKILVDKNAHEKLPIASVTKLMTTLITLEELEKGNLNLTDKILQ